MGNSSLPESDSLLLKGDGPLAEGDGLLPKGMVSRHRVMGAPAIG